MSEEYEVAIGDLVEEYQGSRGHNTGTVRTIGPKHIHVVSTWGGVTRYLRETQQRSDGYPGYFMTTAQRDRVDREAAAMKLLRAHGIASMPHGGWALEQLEQLAKAVADIRNPPELAEEPS